jgi:hypothetical protein
MRSMTKSLLIAPWLGSWTMARRDPGRQVGVVTCPGSGQPGCRPRTPNGSMVRFVLGG